MDDDAPGRSPEVDGRLRDALDHLDDEPAPDLWQRLERSIADDVARRRRRRRVAAIGVLVAVAVGLLAVGRGSPSGWVVDWRWFEVAETLVMLAMVVGLRPLLDDVGRDFLVASFGGSTRTAVAIAPLLDLSWNLVFVGLTLRSVAWAPTLPLGASVAAHLDQGLERVGGLLLAMGVLHATTFLALPMVGVIWRAATTGRPMPRWVLVLLVVVGVPASFVLGVELVGLVLLGQAD